MAIKTTRRQFVKATAATAAGVAAASPARARAPEVLIQSAVKPVVLSDRSGIAYKNGGPVSCVEKAFSMIAEGHDVLDALIAGVNIVELDPEESGVGFGGQPNEEGVVQLDACCMHGTRKQAGGVAALEGVRTPSLVAKAVMEHTDHHLLVGAGAQKFARLMGFEIEDDLNTEKSRRLWLEWKRRIDPAHYLAPARRQEVGYEAALQMVREGKIHEETLWGTVHCNAVNAAGQMAAVTTTSGLAFKIPGRAGDSPILGAGLYVDSGAGAAGSTGRGEANLFNLTCYQIVENMRQGRAPKDAAMDGLQRIRKNTIEKRLLNKRGEPAFNVRFFALNPRGEFAGVSMYASGEVTFGVCTENGAQELPLEGLLAGSPLDQEAE